MPPFHFSKWRLHVPRIDLASRLTPQPDNVIVIEASEDIAEVKSGDLVLVDTTLIPAIGDLVLNGESLIIHRLGLESVGVAYCAIHFFG
jgi:hypothetical protein